MAITNRVTPEAPASMPSPSPVANAAALIGDRRWKRLTERGNEAYAQGDIPLAQAFYEDALTEAGRLFEAAIGGEGALPVPVIYNISCHNLAELLERSGHLKEAEAYFRAAYDQLLQTAQSPAAPIGLRVSCVQHLKHALAVLVQHLRSNDGPDDLIGDVISHAHNTAYSIYRLAQHEMQADAECPHCPISLS